MGRPRKLDVDHFKKKLKWFRIDRYETFRTNQLSLQAWLEQIAIRKFVLTQAKVNANFATREYNENGGLNLFTNFIDLIRKDPAIKDYPIPEEFCGSSTPDHALRARLLPAQPTTVQDIFLWQAFADRSMLESANRFYGSFASQVRKGYEPAWPHTAYGRSLEWLLGDFCDAQELQAESSSEEDRSNIARFESRFGDHARYGDLLSKAMVTIDLDAPDAAILRRVEQLLPLLRKNARTIPCGKFSLEAWAASGLIPYADLQICHLIHSLIAPAEFAGPLPEHVPQRLIFKPYELLSGSVPTRTLAHYQDVFLRDDGGFSELQIRVGMELENSQIRSGGNCRSEPH